jgi:hypothetical protein
MIIRVTIELVKEDTPTERTSPKGDLSIASEKGDLCKIRIPFDFELSSVSVENV